MCPGSIFQETDHRRTRETAKGSDTRDESYATSQSCPETGLASTRTTVGAAMANPDQRQG
jgi:hypothetical protein